LQKYFEVQVEPAGWQVVPCGKHTPLPSGDGHTLAQVFPLGHWLELEQIVL
jgi:hypothetical protein